MSINISERRALEIIEDLKSHPDVDAICLLEAELHRRRKSGFGEADRGAKIVQDRVYDHRGYLICRIKQVGTYCVEHKDTKGTRVNRYYDHRRDAIKFAVERVRQLKPSEYMHYDRGVTLEKITDRLPYSVISK